MQMIKNSKLSESVDLKNINSEYISPLSVQMLDFKGNLYIVTSHTIYLKKGDDYTSLDGY